LIDITAMTKPMPMIDAFVEQWKQHLMKNNKEEYLKYMNNSFEYDNEEIFDDDYTEFASEFVHQYAIIMSQFDSELIIKEYGMKKLIYLLCQHNGDKICDDLLEFNKHNIRSHWVETMLGRILKIY
jgi:hypothetical protein